MEDFVHLHVHTQYSILDGQASIPALVDKAIGNKMRGMAVTDHGNMMGIKEFYNYAQKVIGKAKGALAAAKTELEALHAPDCALSPEERAAKEEELNKTIEKQQRIADFKPIFGCEAYVARRGDKTLREGKQDQSGWHLILLAKNEKGYHNLVKIVSRSWVDGFYMRPRTDHKDLETYSEGIICCSACLGGEIPQKILKGRIEGAEQAVQWFKRVFGDD